MRTIVVLGVVTSALVVACAGRSNSDAVGASHRVVGRRESREGGDAGLDDGAAALPLGYRASFTKVNATPFVSQGHAAGRWDVDVWANELAQKALLSHAREVPTGALVVQEHYERGLGVEGTDRSGPTGPIMVMEKMPPGFSKEHGDWRWVVVGSRGQLVRAGVIESCAGCHDDAPMDGLFPIVE